MLNIANGYIWVRYQNLYSGIWNVLLTLARDKFSIDPWVEVYLVLEEDGTEVDDEEYFQVLGWRGSWRWWRNGGNEILNQQKSAISETTIRDKVANINEKEFQLCNLLSF